MDKTQRDGRRTRHEPHKQDLLVAAVEYILQHGLSDLSIRPLSAALGISHRTLLYHFGSKEELIVEILKEVRAREYNLFNLRLQEDAAASTIDFVQAAWKRFAAPEYEGYFRLFFEVYGLALQEPVLYGGFLEGVVTNWLPIIQNMLIRDGCPIERAPTLATLILSSARGLQLDLLATHDRERAEAAFSALLTILHALLQKF